MGMLQAFEDYGVGAVYYGGVEAGEVDLGGGFAVVAHAFADYREGDALGFGYRCPAVAGYVEGKWNFNPYFLSYAFQVMVDVVANIPVCRAVVVECRMMGRR